MKPESQNKKNAPEAASFFLVAMMLLGSYVGSYFFLESLKGPSVTEVIVIPEPDIPPIASSAPSSFSSSSSSKKKTLPLLSEYIPSQNPFNTVEYQNAPSILYKGDFEEVNAYFNGEVIGNEEVMIMFNFGQETGIVNGKRSSKIRVNIQATRTMKGFFPPASTFTEATVNLLEDELGASSNNLGKCKDGICEFNFFKNTDVAQVAPVLAIPVTISGRYGGAVITDLRIEYLCKEDGVPCEINLCTDKQTAYDCVDEKYGKPEADLWYARYLQGQ